MTPNATYSARADIKTIGQDDEPIELRAGELYTAKGFSQLVSNVTGEVLNLPLHVARNPSWYFHKVGELMSHAPKVSHIEFARELVRGNDGLDFESLWQLGCLEGWFACEKAPAGTHSFSATLSSHDQIEVRKDGVPVKGTKKERGHIKGYTYHAKKAAGRNRDGLFAV